MSDAKARIKASRGCTERAICVAAGTRDDCQRDDSHVRDLLLTNDCRHHLPTVPAELEAPCSLALGGAYEDSRAATGPGRAVLNRLMTEVFA
ncbi:hypothetical protein [Streptomyces sp. CMB-StM0423]|uniref:hypothetical protein n=1 Tax=Streptomyces sp. CMB-StM0423 TaxID=2059884 RepID=UPI000C700004|nr:hypothetical protein [Streptomyces sp. CMB-StM0423]AUH44628.1 hypothetical protein CXR04_34565 [Streptomyces sp. CMB-StM0423]